MPVVSIEGKDCFYQDVGEGYPLLMGHSYLWSSKMWEPQIQSLSKEFRCIAPDLWDHGQSGHLSPHNLSISDLADDAWKLMQHLGVSEFAMIGLSVGGMWGTELALKHPDAVKALVLMDTYVGSEPEAAKQKYFALLDLLAKAQGFTDPLLDQIAPLFFSPHTLAQNPTVVDRFRKELAAIKKEKILGIVALGRTIFSRQCFLDKLSDLLQPTLLLVGRDDIPRPPKESEEMAFLFPNSKIHVIEKAGHICNLEKPEVVNTCLGNFLRENLNEVSFLS